MAANVKDNLLEMKNLSELILDLAYSALFLQDASIVAEVEDLYQEIRSLEDDTLKLLFRVRHLDDEERLVLIDMIDEMRDVAQNARSLAQIVQDHPHPAIVDDVLAEADERVITVDIDPDSDLAGRETGREQLIHATDAQLLAVKRDGHYRFDVDTVTVRAGDRLVAVGSQAAADRLRAVASGEQAFRT